MIIMSATTQILLEKIRECETDLAKARSESLTDAETVLLKKLERLQRELDEANGTLTKKSILKG